MTELSFSNKNNNEFSFSMNNVFSIFFHLCFSIFSHPLYFSYFLFFSPYLLKLLSFLSPLVITTTLLLVALLTFTTPNLVHETFLAWLLVSKDDEEKGEEEIGLVGEFEAYLAMFQASMFEVFEPNKSVEDCSERFEDASDAECPIEVVEKVIEEVKSLEALFQENNADELEENMSCQKEEKEEQVKTVVDDDAAKINKVEEEEEESKEKLSLRSGSNKVKGNSDKYSNKVNGEEHALTKAMKVKSQRVEANLWSSPESNWEYNGKVNQTLSTNLGSFGSMRVEKEWRRTLACKLFEERHNNDGSEGMDMLWETYETESNKVVKKSNSKKGKKSEVEFSEDEEEEEEEMEGKLCCLQALKFSAGKMNLGMGRPNLLKFSKAIKGIGWLHHVGRHGRKSNHSN